MSSIAKRMLEKHGWKEGMGLGPNREGVNKSIRVVRRDPHTPTGLGHLADPNNNLNNNDGFAAELDAVYSSLGTGKRERSKKQKRNNNNNNNKEGEEEMSSESDVTSEGEVSAKKNKNKNKKRKITNNYNNNISNSSSSDNDNDSSSTSSEEDRVDITRLKDDELLKRCGGVRLGRAGRHRFFEGKLRRIEDSKRE